MAIMGTHGIKLEKLADMRKYCKPDIKGVISKQKIRQKRKIFVAFTFCP